MTRKPQNKTDDQRHECKRYQHAKNDGSGFGHAIG